MGKNHVKVIVYGLNRRPKESLYTKEGNPHRIHVLYGPCMGIYLPTFCLPPLKTDMTMDNHHF